MLLINVFVNFLHSFCIFFVETLKNRNFKPKDFQCIACGNLKARRDLIVFVKEEFNFELIQQKISKPISKDGTSISYVCKICQNNLQGLSRGKEVMTKKNDTLYLDYLCTCCHKEFKMKQQVIRFRKKNYDFNNENVKLALNESIRIKNSIYEYICKVCHSNLRKKKECYPQIPKNAYHHVKSEQKESSESGNMRANGGEMHQLRIIGHADYWTNILSVMSKMNSYMKLKQYVNHLSLPALDKNFKGLYQLAHDKRDYLAKVCMPSDIGFPCEELVPVYTTGDGSCLYHALSRVVYGDETHCNEMRVRIIIEGIKNMSYYIDHDYLCRGYDFPHGNDIKLPQMYVVYLNLAQSEKDLNNSDVIKYYEKEMFDMRQFSCESGIWQLHQAASVLGCVIQSVYPTVNAGFTTLRNDYHRLILPANLDTVGSIVRIMWTKANYSSMRFGHFVPLVERNRCLRVVDCNFPPLDYNRDCNINVIVDLTRDIEENGSKDEQFLLKNDSGYFGGCDDSEEKTTMKETQMSWEDTSGRTKDKKKDFLCTCCHNQIHDKCNVISFDVNNYNFELEVVRNVLSDIYRCKDSNGIEYICKTCHESLSCGMPKVPKESVMKKKGSIKSNKYCCTCCHHMGNKLGKRIIAYCKEKYDFDNKIVQYVLSKKYRRKSEDGNEYICLTCSSELMSGKLPRKSAYNKEKVSIIIGGKDNIMKQKYKQKCK